MAIRCCGSRLEPSFGPMSVISMVALCGAEMNASILLALASSGSPVPGRHDAARVGSEVQVTRRLTWR